MKKVIVTGANGFVGSAVCRELCKLGIQVIAIIKDQNEIITNICNLPGIRIIYCEMKDFANLSTLLKDRDIDVIYHFAWWGSAGDCRGDERIQLFNVQSTCDLVRACASIGCKKFVFASSIMTYEIMTQMESQQLPGINTLYSSAKLAADYMAATIAKHLGIVYVRAIISNIYGPGEKSPRLINSSLRKLLKGEHCSFSAGEQMYDFIYIDDAAAAFVNLGEKAKGNKAYYIGSLQPRPLKEFLVEMKNQIDPRIKIGLGEIPYNGISLTYQEFDLFAVKEDTGFVPEISFAEGIKRTSEWIRKEGE